MVAFVHWVCWSITLLFMPYQTKNPNYLVEEQERQISADTQHPEQPKQESADNSKEKEKSKEKENSDLSPSKSPRKSMRKSVRKSMQ